MKQVDSSHYKFSYMNPRRWSSIWHQVRELVALAPESTLEIGPGPGIFKVVAAAYGFDVKTLDIDPELNPDYVDSCMEMPFAEGQWDLVCAFQMLEHLPYADSLKTVREMARVTRRYVAISLPDRTPSVRLLCELPVLGLRRLQFNLPNPLPKTHEFNGEHYWEIGRKGYSAMRIISDFSSVGISLVRNYRSPQLPYHHFFIFEKIR